MKHKEHKEHKKEHHSGKSHPDHKKGDHHGYPANMLDLPHKSIAHAIGISRK